MISKSIRKLRRLHYACVNAVVPFKSMRWLLTTSIVATFMVMTNNVLADLNTYLVGFYLLMLLLSYYLPKGVSHEIDSYGDEEDNPFMFSASLGASSSFDRVEEDEGA